MTDDLVRQSIAELQDIVRCRCHPAYRDRGMQDPNCECDSADAVQIVADRIEELETKLDDIAWSVWTQFKHWDAEKKFALREVVKFLKGDKHE